MALSSLLLNLLSKMLKQLSTKLMTRAQIIRRIWKCYEVVYTIFLQKLYLVTLSPLWSSGQSSWLQTQRSRFDSRRYQSFWEVVGLERDPLSFVSTNEGLLERKTSGSGLENRDYSHRESAAVTTWHPSIRKSWDYLCRQAVVARSV
jgi:hypothetical protein